MNEEGIVCPGCGGHTDVIATKPKKEAIGRYRVCKPCGCRLYSEEIVIRTIKEGINGRKKESKK